MNLNLLIIFVLQYKIKQTKKNLQKYFHPFFSHNLVSICASAIPRAKKGHQQVIFERRREFFVGQPFAETDNQRFSSTYHRSECIVCKFCDINLNT